MRVNITRQKKITMESRKKMNEDLKLFLRLNEIYESKLLLVSDDYDCRKAKKGYEHEYMETKAIFDLLNKIIEEYERD